jgi:hypothetical protein
VGCREAAGDSEEPRGCSGSRRLPIARSQLHQRSAGGCLCAPDRALLVFGNLAAVSWEFAWLSARNARKCCRPRWDVRSNCWRALSVNPLTLLRED